MLKIFTGLVSAAFILASPALAEEAQHRQLGPHVHGQGTLDIAIEGKKIEMELVVPGMDIVGFEHVASTDEQKAAVEKAKAKLTDVLSVFKLPAAAQCKAEAANVESRKEVHHEGDEDHDEDEKEGHARAFRVPRHVHDQLRSAGKCHRSRDRLLRELCRRAAAERQCDDVKGPDASTDDARQADGSISQG